MFSREAVRSVKEIKQGMLSRAFERGGQAEYDKTELLIEWRLAACRHYAQQTALSFDQEYRLEEFNNAPQDCSRALNAMNLVAHIDGSESRLMTSISYEDAVIALKDEITARQADVEHHNRAMDVIWKAPEFDFSQHAAKGAENAGNPFSIEPVSKSSLGTFLQQKIPPCPVVKKQTFH